jgi:hypothetical protein
VPLEHGLQGNPNREVPAGNFSLWEIPCRVVRRVNSIYLYLPLLSVNYVSTAWLSEVGWALLGEAVRLSGFRRYAEVVRAAVYTAVVEVARGAGLASPASVEVEGEASFRPQLGRLREVAVRLASPVPVKRIQKWLAERLGASKVSMGVALEWALATYINVLRQKPAGLPGPVREMLAQVYLRVKSAPRSEKKAVAVNELKLRLGTAKELAKALGLPVDRWWESIAEEVAAAGDPEAVLMRYLEGGEVPRVKASDRFAEAVVLVLKEVKDAESLKRLWWTKRGLLLRAAGSKPEREIVKMIDMYVERDPEAALKVLRAVERGERPPPPPPPPFDRAGFYASVQTRLETFDAIARRILERAKEVGLPYALYSAGEYFRGFVKAAERDLKVMLDKAPPDAREEDELRQKLEAALDAAAAVAAAGTAAGVVGREVQELTEMAVQKFLTYCRRYLGLV